MYNHGCLVNYADWRNFALTFILSCQTTSIWSQFTHYQGTSSTLSARQYQSTSLEIHNCLFYLCWYFRRFNCLILQERLDYAEDGRLVFKLRLRICSTLYPANDGIRDFFVEYDRHVLQTSPPWGSELLEVYIISLKFMEYVLLLCI